MILLLGATSAFAWTHTTFVWNREDLPRTWYMSDYVEDSLPQEAIYGATGDLLYQEEAIVRSFDAWAVGAPCAELSHTNGGWLEGIWAGGSDNEGTTITYY